MAHFTIKDLTFSYPTGNGKAVLDHINLSIRQGEYIALCGKSGSGKTTLLKHMKQVLAPHGKRSGEVLFEDRPVESMSLADQTALIGYVMQNPDDQIVTDKVWHELAFGLESLGTDQKTMRLRVAEMASYFGIQDWFHRNVADLSGGQKQLLNLASIMAMQPKVLILDEPTSQLDPIAAADFLNTVRKINLELGTTVIITEHRLEDIFHAADRVVVLEEGRVLADDTPKAVGAHLYRMLHPMFAAMPSPMQIYYDVVRPPVEEQIYTEETDTLSPERNQKTADPAQRPGASDCPLTVREGRRWLSDLFNDREPTVRATEAEAERNEDAEMAVELKEVWFRYEKDAPDVLKGLSAKVPKGSVYAIVGGNGTGKSTALKAICNICRPYRGKIFVGGKRVDKMKSGELFAGNLAMLPQDPQSLFVKKTVREDLEEMLEGKSADKTKKGSDADSPGNPRNRIIRDVAALCQIQDLLDSHPYDLSGGEQQRAALAKVLLTDPKILLLDEPTKGMDNFFKRTFAQILSDLKTGGVTILLVSHDVEFCARHADLVSMFFDGGIITTNTPRRFFSQNSFYTTAANRMSRHLFDGAVTNEDVIGLCRQNRLAIE